VFFVSSCAPVNSSVGKISNERTVAPRSAPHTNYYKMFHYFRQTYADLRETYWNITVRLHVPYKWQLPHHCGTFSRTLAPVRRHEATVDTILPAPDPVHDATACAAPVLISANASLCGT
jgi:hypothetical protein